MSYFLVTRNSSVAFSTLLESIENRNITEKGKNSEQRRTTCAKGIKIVYSNPVQMSPGISGSSHDKFNQLQTTTTVRVIITREKYTWVGTFSFPSSAIWQCSFIATKEDVTKYQEK